MSDRLPLILRTDTDPPRLQELPSGDRLPLSVHAEGVAEAVAMAKTFTAVPAEFQSWVILVTQPHFRTFMWNPAQKKYERAPWHRPGIIFPSDGDPARITNGIQLRSDVVYNTADYPDLAEFYGFTGPTFVLKDARARVIRGADLGKGTDAALVNGYLQEDAIRNIWGRFQGRAAVTTNILDTLSDVTRNGAFSGEGHTGDEWASALTIAANTGKVKNTAIKLDASTQVPTASENRVKSLVATHYVTF